MWLNKVVYRHVSLSLLQYADYHPHFDGRILPSAIRHPPCAIRHHPVLKSQTPDQDCTPPLDTGNDKLVPDTSWKKKKLYWFHRKLDLHRCIFSWSLIKTNACTNFLKDTSLRHTCISQFQTKHRFNLAKNLFTRETVQSVIHSNSLMCSWRSFQRYSMYSWSTIIDLGCLPFTRKNRLADSCSNWMGQISKRNFHGHVLG